MTPKARTSLANISLVVGAVVGVFSIAGGATTYVHAVADHAYVRADSFRAFRAGQALQRQGDSTANAQRDSLIRRIDARVGAMWCASVHQSKANGCQ